jgi:cytochrome P450
MNAPVDHATFARTETPRDRYRKIPEVKFAQLAHLPGVPQTTFPLLTTIRFLKDPLSFVKARVEEFGRVYRVNNFGGWNVAMIGPEANELVLFDRDKNFSSEQGWNPVLEYVFPRGLMLMDFEEHKVHRKTLSVAFKPAPMQAYLGELQAGIARGVAKFPKSPEEFRFYPAIKQLTLDLAASSFLGIPWGPEAEKINRSFVDMVAASVGIVRVPVPGTAMWRGVRGRKFMCEFFGREIPKRRGAAGDDIFTQICNAEHDDGRRLSDQEIIDHMNFLMMAAHDTLTSSITSTVYYLAKHPEWQEWVREQVLSVPELTYDTLGSQDRIEMAFKEAMRLMPPVPGIPRRAQREFTFMNHVIPAGAHVGVNPMMTHRLPEVWPDPDRFDPTRFTPEASKGRHKYAWVPFGGGGHMCLGLHFAYMQAKAFFHHTLSNYRLVLPEGYEADVQMFPIPKPKDGLPIRFEAL